MGEAGREAVLTGIPAAEGLAFGTLALDGGVALGRRSTGDPTSERRALADAVAAARRQLEALIAGEDEMAGEILEFQLALIEDDELIAPILAAVETGATADQAWGAALEREIADYRDGGDEYFAARADDLEDLKGRVLRALADAEETPVAGVPADAIYIAPDLTPSRLLELDWGRYRGAAICGGSRTSHVAILARARGIPLLVGLEADLSELSEGAEAILDAEAGRLILRPSAATAAALRGRLDARAAEARAAEAGLTAPAVTAAGTAVRVLINVDDPALLEGLPPEACDGVGLTRSEFLFHDGPPPDEAAQLAAYRKVLDWAAGRPVTIRALDAGGDKPIAGVTPEGEANPFLGVRGLRLLLRRPALFRVQLRALARAAAAGPLKVMLPMVTVPGELARARALLAEVLAELAAEGVEHGNPALGMMVEVPAAALTAADFAADFYSIGSNDLTQYVTAAARDNPALAGLADPSNPAVLELIRRTVEAGRARGVEVSLCGDMASEPALVPALLDCGLTVLSVAPPWVGAVKQAVRGHGAS